MEKIFVLFFVIAVSVSTGSYAQLTASGRVKNIQDSTAVPHATLINIKTKQIVIADYRGAFSIKGYLFDTLVISSVGYKNDTVLIDADFFMKQRDLYIAKTGYHLEGVTITDDRYKADSIDARAAYEMVFDKRTRLVENRNSYQGFGLSFSPFSFLSKEAKAKRRYIKRFQVQEEQEYVNYRFSRAKITGLTGLKGDSLQQFMIKYRPTYEFCKKASDLDILLYVNDCLKVYLKREEEQ